MNIHDLMEYLTKEFNIKDEDKIRALYKMVRRFSHSEKIGVYKVVSIWLDSITTNSLKRELMNKIGHHKTMMREEAL